MCIRLYITFIRDKADSWPKRKTPPCLNFDVHVAIYCPLPAFGGSIRPWCHIVFWLAESHLQVCVNTNLPIFPCIAIQRTVEVWPCSTCLHSPESVSHTYSCTCPLCQHLSIVHVMLYLTLRVRSVEPLTIVLPSNCEHHTPPVCPVSVFRCCGNISTTHPLHKSAMFWLLF